MKIVSLFSGAGGLDLGFKRAGHEIIWANDLYADAVETYKINIGHHIVFKNIAEVHISEIPNCDIVIGGFPCQGFSVANIKRNTEDQRNNLYKEMLRIIEGKKPKYFVAENVKGILSLGKGKIFSMIISDLISLGYKVTYKLLNAADYGVPQKRERVFIVGIRSDIDEEFFFPKPTHSEDGKLEDTKPWVSVSEALHDIPDPDTPNSLYNHEYSKYKLRFNGYLGHREVNPAKPSPTVTGRGDDKGGVVVLHHPNNERRMSCREMATVQSFPLDYEFYGTKSSVYRQIANAVPPLLAEAIAKQF